MAQWHEVRFFKVDEEKNTSDWASYRKFIESLRRLVARRDTPESRDVFFLPPQQDIPTQWLDVVLQTNENAVRLRIRRDNLYLVGFRAENSDRWHEFQPNPRPPNPPPPHLIEDSAFMGFDGSYGDLARVLGRQSIEGIGLGPQQLTTAVERLADPETGREERAKSLIVVIQMICEAIRCELISNHIATVYRRGTEILPGMLVIERGWSHNSDSLRRVDAHVGTEPPPRPSPPIEIPQDILSRTRDIIEGFMFLNPWAFVAVLLLPRDCGGVRGGGRELRAVCPPEGRPMLEVIWVCIDNIDGSEDTGELYGNIQVTDDLGTQVIYNRSSDNYESISLGGTLSLTGPERSFSAFGDFTISVDLKDYDPLSDDQVSNGEILWNAFNTASNVYDEPLDDPVSGGEGNVMVKYIVLSNAVHATIKVILEDRDMNNLYGKITARCPEFGEDAQDQVTLFQKTKERGIKVHNRSAIELSRSKVAVPLGSSLTVSADLRDVRPPLIADPIDYQWFDFTEEIACRTAEFPAAQSSYGGKSVKTISGKNGSILVEVTWDV